MMGLLDALNVGSNILDNLINLGGVIGTNIANRKSVENTNATNLQIARETNQAQIDLANTAVSRRARDLESAGFNRLLAATGEGASTPSLASPSMQAFQAQQGQSEFGSMFSHALELAEYKRQKEMQEEQIANLKKQNSLLDSQKKKTDYEAKEAERAYNFNLLDQDNYSEYLATKRQRELESMDLANKGLDQENRIREPQAENFGDNGYVAPQSSLGKIVQDFSNIVQNTNNIFSKKRAEKKAEKEAKKKHEKEVKEDMKRRGIKSTKTKGNKTYIKVDKNYNPYDQDNY